MSYWRFFALYLIALAGSAACLAVVLVIDATPMWQIVFASAGFGWTATYTFESFRLCRGGRP